MKIDLNSDLGESFGRWRKGNDGDMLKIVTSANIACGFHAGDPAEMMRSCEGCRQEGVAIGAHPGFRDLEGFGRDEIHGIGKDRLRALVAYQIGALLAVTRLTETRLRHVKLHGALANMASRDPSMATTLLQAIQAVDHRLPVIVIASTCLQSVAESLDVPHAKEIFADRAYHADATLVSRHRAGAVISDPEQCAERMLRAIETGRLIAIDGSEVEVAPDTICVHGDTPHAVAIASAVRDKLERNGVTIERFSA